MRLVPSCLRIPLLASLLLIAVATATSAAPVSIELNDQSPVIVESSAATCQLQAGPLGTVQSGWIAGLYWRTVSWKIPRTSCVACPAPQILNITGVHFRARLLNPCSASADVYIVGAQPNPQCPATPDTNQVLCGPVNVVLDAPAGTSKTYDVALPSACCIAGDAFVMIRFNGLEDCADNQSLVITQSTTQCVDCDEFYEVPGLHPFPTDWCNGSTTGRASLWFRVDADCCAATPSQQRSWGRVKTHYR